MSQHTEDLSENGQFEQFDPDKKLTAHVVTPGSEPAIHGYDVEADLARHYSFGELALLTLTGAPPSREVGRAFDVCLSFLAPLSIGEAPCHVAALSRMYGAPDKSVAAVGAVGLAEQAGSTMEDHRPLVAWLATGSAPFPARFATDDPAEREAVERLKAALADCSIDLPILDENPTRMAALLGILYACGLHRWQQMLIAIMMARLPALAAESLRARPGSFLKYPLRLPDFRYEGGDEPPEESKEDPPEESKGDPND